MPGFNNDWNDISYQSNSSGEPHNYIGDPMYESWAWGAGWAPNGPFINPDGSTNWENFYLPGAGINGETGGQSQFTKLGDTYDQSLSKWLMENNAGVDRTSLGNHMYTDQFFMNGVADPSKSNTFSTYNPIEAGIFSALVGMANPATLGGLFGLTGAGAAAAGGAMMGGFGAAGAGGDPVRGALGGGLLANIPSLGIPEAMGVSDPGYARSINGAIKGAGTSALNGTDPVMGGVMGSLPGLGQKGLSVVGDSLKNMFGWNTTQPNYVATDQGVQMSNDISQMSHAPGMSSAGSLADAWASPAPNPNQSMVADYLPQNDPYFAGGGPQLGSSQPNMREQVSNVFTNGFQSPFSNNRIGLGDFAGGLMGLYQSNQQRKRASQMYGQLSGLYGQNSPYAQQLQKTLQRQDAASGRRSNYAGRGVELQARLAENNSRLAPTLMNLESQRDQGMMGMFNNMLGLGSMFAGPGFSKYGGPQTPYKPQSLPSLNSYNPTPNYALDSTDMWKKIHEGQ